MFRDPTLGAAVNPINGAPFNSWLLSANGAGSGISSGASRRYGLYIPIAGRAAFLGWGMGTPAGTDPAWEPIAVQWLHTANNNLIRCSASAFPVGKSWPSHTAYTLCSFISKRHPIDCEAKFPDGLSGLLAK
jgi:hypothetical protein